MADASKPYGDVSYADTGYQADGKKRYPIDSEEHIRAAWSYINQADNASKYSPERLAVVKSRIKAAGKRFGITFEGDEASRSFAAGEHPRVPSGPGGGEFANAGGGKTPAKAPPPKNSKAPAHAAHHTSGHGTLGYDPKSDHGTGYGSAHGDSRVHTLQQALNRLGLTDAHGKPLKDDGKLGPRTTAAVKKLQQRLGMKADGQVTPEFLKSVSGMKTLPAHHATAKRGEDLADVNRSEDLLAWPALITRSFAVDDAAVRSGRVTCEGCGLDATGRMVDAYAAVFGEETEVHDDHGHYIEDIDRAAFNRRLDHITRSAAGVRGVNVYYNHAMTVHGSPSELASVPVGHPSIIRADNRGLLTATHYSRDPFADRILNGIIDGNIAGQSFTGRIVRSDPDRIPRINRGGSLPKVRRLELGLTEYGPTPQPYYAGALTVAVRAQLPDQHPDGPADTAPPPQQSGPGAEDPHIRALRSAAEENRRKIRRALVLRGLHDGNKRE